MRAKRSTLYLPIIMAVAVLLRVGIALYLGDVVDAPEMLTDQRSYHALGVRLIEGYGFSFAENWYPLTYAGQPTAHWSFLYSLFVAAVYALCGVHPLAVRLLSAVLGGVLLPWAVFRLTRLLMSDEANGTQGKRPPASIPLIAALLAAVYAYFSLYAATLMTETFYTIALIWSLERALLLARAPSARHGVMLGLALGTAALLRQAILPWLAVLFIWLVWQSRYRGQARPMIGGLIAASLIVAAMIAPFTLRNYRVYGTFLLLNSNAGFAFYSAQHPLHGTNFQEYAIAPIPEEMRTLNEAQWDRALMRLGIQTVLDDPVRYVLLSLSRVRDYFLFWPTSDTSLLNNVGRVISFGLFLPFMLYGVALSIYQARAARRRWRDILQMPTGLAVIFLVFYSLLHIFTWAMPRYRLPVDAVALPFAALAFVHLVTRVRSEHNPHHAILQEKESVSLQ